MIHSLIGYMKPLRQFSLGHSLCFARISDQRTHFLLMPFGTDPIPDRWHLTRADLDY